MTHTEVVILEIGDRIKQTNPAYAFERDSVWRITGIDELGIDTFGETIPAPRYIPFRELRKEYEREVAPCR